MRQTISFNNSLDFWKTRYSYTPSCMMNLNRLFFSSPYQKLPLDGNKMIWRHNDSSNAFNTFYNEGGHNGPSALGISFNGYTGKTTSSAAANLSSSNKIYKSFSIQGGNNIENVQGNSLFRVNNNSTNLAEDRHLIADLQFKGTAIYGEIGKEDSLSGMNIKAIGKIRNVYKWQNMPEATGINNWRNLTTGGSTPVYTQIAGLHVDANGNDVVPDIEDRLYAFEIESFMSNNPIPATISGGGPHEFVKFFSGRINDDGNGMQSVPYVSEGLYTPNSGQYQVNFVEAFNFDGSEDYGRFLSYGDPYTDENNSFKKGNYLMIQVRQIEDDECQHLRFENTPGASESGNGNGNTFEDYVFDEREVLFAMTPGVINGSDPHGTFADAYVTLGSANFEVTSFNVEYELTEYDHGGRSSNLVSKK